jgi:U3 small nucleolar RNA-associated protein 13
MASAASSKVTFTQQHVINPIFTGGAVALDQSRRFLVTTLVEDAVITDLSTGEQLTTIEGVSLG